MWSSRAGEVTARRRRHRCRRCLLEQLPPPLLHSGPLERVCQRWRRLALQLPTGLTIEMVPLVHITMRSDEGAAAAALERLLPLLTCRRIAALSLSTYDLTVTPEVPALLTRVLYPELCRWVGTCTVPALAGNSNENLVLGTAICLMMPVLTQHAKQLSLCLCSLKLRGFGLLHFTTYLPMCRRLEELSLDAQYEADAGGRLLCNHLWCGLWGMHAGLVHVLQSSREASVFCWAPTLPPWLHAPHAAVWRAPYSGWSCTWTCLSPG